MLSYNMKELTTIFVQKAFKLLIVSKYLYLIKVAKVVLLKFFLTSLRAACLSLIKLSGGLNNARLQPYPIFKAIGLTQS